MPPKWTDGLVDAFPIPEDETPLTEDLENLNINDASAEDPDNSTRTPFPFFSLPAEIRNRIYYLVLFSKPGYRLATGSRRGSRIAVLLVSQRFHREASYALYNTHRFLIFPLQEFVSIPTIEELPPHYRILVSNLHMSVGSSWFDPPKSWHVTRALARCLRNLKNVQTLSVFVQFDPSGPMWKMHRRSEEFYTDFCGELLGDVLEAMPQLQYVQLDGNKSVDVHGPLVSRLREEALLQEKTVRWGANAKWAHIFDEDLVPEEYRVPDLKALVTSRQETVRSSEVAAYMATEDKPKKGKKKIKNKPTKSRIT